MVIYKQYDQAALDRQYNNRLQVPEWAEYLAKGERISREAEKKYSPLKDIAYGEGSLEKLDIFPSSLPNSKVLVFIHGGYWYKMDKSDFQFVGAGFHPYDITTVIINYPLAPVVTIEQIVQSCRKALQWVSKNILNHNGDPKQLYIAGHSAGGHLAAMMMAGNPQWGSTMQGVKGVCAMSGLFNLLPIQLSNINEAVHLDDKIVLQNSPVKLQPVLFCPLIIAVGGNEADEFKAQSAELFDCWKDMVPIELVELEGVNHYSIIEVAAEAGTDMHQQLKKLIAL